MSQILSDEPVEGWACQPSTCWTATPCLTWSWNSERVSPPRRSARPTA